LYYSTEQVLKLRNSKIDTNEQKILYNSKDEKDSCGVGLIANMKSIPSRHVVEVADEMLVRMAHRGGCGCDPASGDGAGELF
jgi:glutamate synthase domain-containing protein 1